MPDTAASSSASPASVAPWLYLASQSPRRRQLLDQLGVAHRLLLPDDAEAAELLEVELPGEAPDDYVRRVTLAKWQDAAARLAARHQADPAAWPLASILCADTTVALDGDILGKPRDTQDAVHMLRRLSGRVHRVLTAVVVDGQARLSISGVHWRSLTDEEVQRYAGSGEPMGKAGAYAIQSRAGAWTSRIEGSYSGIMGLPLFDTAELLKPLGFHF